MLETLLGTLFGGAFRMMPEFLKWFDRKDERKHELAMFDKQLEADRMRAELNLAQIESQANATIGAAEVQAIIEATKTQGTHTGIRWVDAVNSLMRPAITFWWVIVMYTATLIAEFVVLRAGGTAYTAAIIELWGPDEKAIVASIISFWFVDRSLRKMR